MARVRDFLAAGPTAAPGAPAPPPPTVSAPPSDSTQVLSAAVPPASPPASPPQRRNRTPTVAVLGALAAVAVLAAIAWATTSGDDEAGPTGATRKPSGGSSAASSPSAPTSSSSPDVTADGMEGFVEDYLATVTSDPKATWSRLTPEFQRESGGFGQYKRFWSGFRSADLLTDHADPASRQISYTVEYLRQDGTKTRDDVTLTLTGTDGNYLISGES